MLKLYRLTLTLLAALLVSACSSEPSAPTPKGSTSVAPAATGQYIGLPVEGKPFPRLVLTTLDGKRVDSTALFKGKTVILNIWATWCPPCREEMPDLIALSKALPEERFVVAGLSVDNDIRQLAAYTGQAGIPFPLFQDPNGRGISEPLLGVTKYHETFVISKDGVLLTKVIGAYPWGDPKVIELLRQIDATGQLPAE